MEQPTPLADANCNFLYHKKRTSREAVPFVLFLRWSVVVVAMSFAAPMLHILRDNRFYQKFSAASVAEGRD